MKKLTTILMLLSFVLISQQCYGDSSEENTNSKTLKEETTLSETIVPLVEAIPEEEEVTETYRITYYCGCKSCCGKWSTNPPIVGAYGRELIDGYSCASPLPDGTEIEIKGYGTVRVDDTTAKWVVNKYDGKIIDIYVSDHSKKPEGIQDYMEIVVKKEK